MTYKVFSDEETELVGKELASTLEKTGISSAFIAMRGEMGVGKTVFTRGFASHFGIKGVKSPTYTVVNEYRGRVKIYHFDLYRISDADDLVSVGYDDYVADEAFCICEWSERIPEEIPDGAITVSISRVPDDEAARIIEISGVEEL
nr:tRNA (adenosine(37)-N6)-threonylcarbamoyltransferase complex ATPase subunit type 1 TsaE [Clostridia bacterium]